MDAKTAKANAAAAKAQAKALRPWYKKKRFIFSGIIVALIALAAVSSGGGSDSDKDTSTPAADGGTTAPASNGAISNQSSGSNPAAADVTIVSCENDDTLDIGQPKVKILNHSSKPSNYIVAIKVESPDGKTLYDTAQASAENVANGQSTEVEGYMGKAIPPGAVCKVGEVTRYAS